MRTVFALLLPSLLFAALALPVRARFGRRGVIAFALAWLAMAAVVIFATLPPASRQLHDFERSPLPALLGTIAGTTVAVALLSRPTVHPRIVVTGVQSAVGYATTAAIVSVLTFLALAW